jgi:hypothetical protein
VGGGLRESAGRQRHGGCSRGTPGQGGARTRPCGVGWPGRARRRHEHRVRRTSPNRKQRTIGPRGASNVRSMNEAPTPWDATRVRRNPSSNPFDRKKSRPSRVYDGAIRRFPNSHPQGGGVGRNERRSQRLRILGSPSVGTPPRPSRIRRETASPRTMARPHFFGSKSPTTRCGTGANGADSRTNTPTVPDSTVAPDVPRRCGVRAVRTAPITRDPRPHRGQVPHNRARGETPQGFRPGRLGRAFPRDRSER